MPYEGKFVEIGKGREIQTDDFDFALALGQYPYIEVEWPKEKKDQLKFKRTQLVQWAAHLEIPDAFYLDKRALIGKISEVLT